MSDRAVDLPKPNPDDDEDVVAWLSTARALWASGERSDALVWLRRAAEAAAMAGQPFRASEIGMYVTALEETFGDPPARPATPPPVEVKRELADTMVDPVEAFGALASEVLRTKRTSIEVELEEDTIIEETPGALAAEQSHAAPPQPPPPVHKAPPPPTFSPSAAPGPRAAGGTARPAAAAPSFAPQRPPSAPPPGFSPPLSAPHTPEGEEITLVSAGLRGAAMLPPSSPASSPLATTPTPPLMRAPPSGMAPPPGGMAPPPPSFGLPPLEVPRPPPTPRGEGFGPLRDAHLDGAAAAPRPGHPRSAPPPPMSEGAPGSSAAPSHVPPSAPRSAPPPPRPPMPSVPASALPPRSPLPSSTGVSAAPMSPRRAGIKRPAQRVPRQPILDPWAEDQSATPPILRPTPKADREEVVVVRARFPSVHEEDEVFTSAAPLPASLRRSPSSASSGAAPPPPLPSTGAVSVPAAAPSASGGGTTIAVAPVAPPVSVRPMVPTKSPPPVITAPSASVQPGRLASAATVPAKSVPPPAKPLAVSAPAPRIAGDAAAEAIGEPAATPGTVEVEAVSPAPHEDAIGAAESSARVTQESRAKPAPEPPAKDTQESRAKPAPEPPAKDTQESRARAADPHAAKETQETAVIGAQPKAALLPRSGPPTIPRPATGKPSIPAPTGKVTGTQPVAKIVTSALPAKVAPPAPATSRPPAMSAPRPASSPPPSGSERPAITNAVRPPTVHPAAAPPAPVAASSRPPVTAAIHASAPVTSPAPASAAAPRPATVPPAPAMMKSHAPQAESAPRPATAPPAPVRMRPPSVPPPRDPFDSDPLGPNAFGGDTVPAPPLDEPPHQAASSTDTHGDGASDAFEPARPTQPMKMEIEPPEHPLALPSMRATLPMPLELPKDLEAMFAETGDVPVRIEGVRLDTVDALDGTPRAVQQALADKAQIVELGPDEEVSGFSGAMLLSGLAILCATIVDAAAHWARPGEMLVARGSLQDGIAVRVVGAGDGAKIAVWPRGVLEELFAQHQAAVARARAFGDRLQALAGATMGPFGELEDEERRALAMELSVRCLRPGEIWLEDGAPAPGVALVGAGAVELYGPISDETSETVEPGSLVFPSLAVLGGEAPASARAGAHGALLLVAESDAAKRLSDRIPDLADRLRGA